MGFENKYPYTDFHELNLDWILEVVKRLETEWPEYKTALETEWNNYKDSLTGEGGEWPTFKAAVETTINNFIHDVVGQYNGNINYQPGMFCYYEGNVYKCMTGSSAAFPRPFNSYNWFNYSNQDTNSIVNDLYNYLSTQLNSQDTKIYNWIMNTAEQWDSEKSYVAGDYCSAIVGGFGVPPTWRYFKCLQDCTDVSVLNTDYWEEVVFATDVAERIAAYKQAMQDQYDAFLEDYQRTFGVVQTTGSSTTDVMSQKAVSDELQAIDNTFDDIESGQEVVGHAAVADELTPYSENSGVLQKSAFINQGTGTANNTVIVTTGDKCQQIKKLGTAYVYNQTARELSSTYYGTSNGTATFSDGIASFTATAQEGYLVSKSGYRQKVVTGHLYLGVAKIKLTTATGMVKYRMYVGNNSTANHNIQGTTNWQDVYVIDTATTTGDGLVGIIDYRTSDWDAVQVTNLKFIDLTQWFNGNDNIPQDLLDNPSHFSWWCNMPLTFNAGNIVHSAGRFLECGQGRNLWDEEWENGGISSTTGEPNTDASRIRSKNYIRVIPNTTLHFYIPAVTRVFFYDNNKNYLGYLDAGLNSNKVVFSNAEYMKFHVGNSSTPITTYANNITISLYYTPAEGGEGYDEYYAYVAPKRVDTGNEQLYQAGTARDVKVPSGLITRNVGSIDAGDLNYTYYENDGHHYFGATISNRYNANGNFNVVCGLYPTYTDTHGTSAAMPALATAHDKTLFVNSGSKSIFFSNSAYASADAFKASVTGMIIYYELNDASKYTEQGTSFSEYADIDDYSYMAWLDTDEELVELPQGCELFYPVNYKGFIDDTYMYTDGDATALALKNDITDAALAARGYLKLIAISGYDATKTQTLKNVQGVFTWVDDQ